MITYTDDTTPAVPARRVQRATVTMPGGSADIVLEDTGRVVPVCLAAHPHGGSHGVHLSVQATWQTEARAHAILDILAAHAVAIADEVAALEVSP